MNSPSRRVPCVLILLLSLAAFAASAEGPAPIRLRSGVVAPAESGAGLPERLRVPRAELFEGGQAVVRLAQPGGATVRDALRSAGARIVAWIDGSAAVVSLERGALPGVEGLPQVAFLEPYHPGLRIAPEVAALSAADGSPFPATVHLAPRVPVDEVAARLRALGLPVAGRAKGDTEGSGGALGRIVLQTTAAQLAEYREAIAAWPEVFWIGRRPSYRLLNDASVWVGQAGLERPGETPVHDRGIRGEGQVVGVLDTGLDADMCFFREEDGSLPPTQLGSGTGDPDPTRRKVRIVDFLWVEEDPTDPTDWDTQDHGTHVAGTIAGDDLATPGRRDAADGMAPAAQLVIQDGGYRTDDCADMPAIGCPAASLEPFFQQAYDQGARIHSNSYGDRENFTPYNIYSDGSEDADRFMWEHPEFLLVFAAGNNGPGADTVASPATAKNVLAVGATNHGSGAGSLASFSSQGSTHDGRIKPDVTVPGSGVISANNDGDVESGNCGTRSMSGTSMACPTAAGLSALVRQYFTDGYYPSGESRPADGFVPTAALVKAAVLVSAAAMEEIATPPPSIEQGWGRILLDDALYFPYDGRRLRAFDERDGFAAPSDSARSYDVDVLDAALPLRAVLTWTDAPSNPAADVNLLNDLDLIATSPSGAVYRGNGLVDGASQPGGSADRIENVEVLRIEDPEPGMWTLEVAPHAVPVPAQGYALAVTGRLPAAGVVLERTSLTLDDSVGGNGDGVLDPGEWVDLPLTLLNSGDTTAQDVRARLSSASPWVQVIRPQTTFGDLASGESGAPTTAPPRIHLSPELPCGETVSLVFTYSADGFERDESDVFGSGREVEIVRDEFEVDNGWVHVPAESTATTGDWLRGDPNGTDYQPEDDATPEPGRECLFTAQNSSAGTDDVDDGVVVARSGAYDLSGHPEARLRLARWFGHRDLGEDAGDFYRLSIRESPAAPDVLLEELGSEESAARWSVRTFRVADYVVPGPEVELKVEASDGPASGNLVEAAVDDVVFFYPECATHDPAPNRVLDLRVDRGGQDAQLSWSRPEPDPEHGHVDRYRVHRSEEPGGGFSEREVVEDDGSSPSWTDAGAAGEAPPFYAWLVVAENDAGAADEPPAGP